MSLDKGTRKWLRRIGHGLNPVVTLGDKGLTDSAQAEVERALGDHELVKIRISGAAREQRQRLATELTAAVTAECVQVIGHVLLLYRRAERPDPKLSNLLRHGGRQGS